MVGTVGRLVFAAVICASLSGQAVAAKLLKLNESLGPGSVEEAALLEFKKLVEEGSKGEIRIQIHLQDELGKPETALENLMTGSLDLYSGALEYYAPIAGPEINATSLPYLISTHDQLRAYLKSDAFKPAIDKLQARGIRFLSTEFNGDRGPYRVLAASRPVNSLKDLEGLKVRMFPNEVYIRSWKQLGAVPVQLAFTETYLGIRQGIVNGVTLGIGLLRSTKFTEVAPYIVEIREYAQTWPMTISERVWRRLSVDEQALLIRAANEAGKVYGRLTAERAQGDLDEMIRVNKAVVLKPDLSEFRARMQPLFSELVKEGALTQPLLDGIKAFSK